MRLARWNKSNFDRGAVKLIEGCWLIVLLLFSSLLPGSFWRTSLLRLFGASVGHGVIIKPGVRVKFPWKLTLGDNCWVGENAWIDNLDVVEIGHDTCLSQGVYLCTGSHDWSKESFDLITKPIEVKEYAWVGAFSRLAPGIKVGVGSVCVLGSVVTRSTDDWSVYAGNPAVKVRDRPRY